MAWALVTPSSRGIGHALTRHLLLNTPASLPIVATARRDVQGTRESLLASLPASATAKVEAERRLDVRECDLESESSIRDLAAYCRERYQQNKTQNQIDRSNNDDEDDDTGSRIRDVVGGHLRLAFCLPGVLGPNPERSPSQIDATTTLSTLKLNLIAPMLVAKHFVDFLPTKAQVRKISDQARENRQQQQQQHKTSHPAAAAAAPSPSLPPIPGLNPLNPLNPQTQTLTHTHDPRACFAIMSARIGSISDNTNQGGWYAYRCSKAGVNQLVKSLNIHVERVSGGHAICVGLHPGTVRTGLTRPFWAAVKARKDKEDKEEDKEEEKEEEKGEGEGQDEKKKKERKMGKGVFEPEEAAERLVGVVARLMGREGMGGGGGGSSLGQGEEGGRCWDWKGEEILP